MPRARLIVDGYNVSKTAWPTSSLEAQRIRLLNGLAPLVARTGVGDDGGLRRGRVDHPPGGRRRPAG